MSPALPAALSKLRDWLVPRAPEYHARPLRRVWLVCVYTVQRWYADGCPSMAASLALQTLLSLVPLAAVVMSVIRTVDPELGRTVLLRLAAGLSPTGTARMQDFADTVLDMGDSVSIGQLGSWGFLAIVLLAYFLFSTLENTFNRIWRNTRSGRTVAKFTTFYTLATLFPVVMMYSLAQPILADLTSTFFYSPALFTFLVLVLLNRHMPRQEVRWRAALAGGFVSALLFELTKFAFGRYLALVAMPTYEGLYGSLAIWPVFVVWCYVTWIIVLLGAQIAFVVHSLPALRREGWVHPRNHRDTMPHAHPGRAAARLLLAIADHFDRRSAGTSAEELDQRFGLGLARTTSLLDHMENAGLILPVAGDHQRFVPARPLDRLGVEEVLGLFDPDLPASRDDALAALFAELDEHARARVRDLDFHALVSEERARRDAPPLGPERADSGPKGGL